MTEEQAWDAINRQIKKDDGRLIRVVVSLFLVIAGVVTIIFYAPAGLAVMAAGIIMMSLSARRIPRNSIDIDDVYEKNILAKWLSEYFEDVEFGTKKCLTVKDVKKTGLFSDAASSISVDRSFAGTRNGNFVRACEVTAAVPESKNSHGKLGIDYAEPLYTFWGRVFEMTFTDEEKQRRAEEEIRTRGMECFILDGKLYFTQNLYSETGSYPVWLPSPDKDNRNPVQMHEEVRRQIEPYLL